MLLHAGWIMEGCSQAADGEFCVKHPWVSNKISECSQGEGSFDRSQLSPGASHPQVRHNDCLLLAALLSSPKVPW